MSDDAKPDTAPSPRLGGYATVAIMFVNLILFLAVLNGLAWLGLKAIDAVKVHTGDLIADNPWTDRQKVYPEWEKADILALLKERGEWPTYVYEPLAQFKEAPGKGRYYTITEHGFRTPGEDQPWPPDPIRKNIFVFGGSTTFGWGLPDNETIPAALGNVLDPSRDKIAVYNFGQSYQFSTHEILFFQRLLMAGHKPDVAVFVDGVNEFFHFDTFLYMTDNIRRSMARTEQTLGNSLLGILRSLPIMEFGGKLISKFARTSLQQQAADNVRRVVKEGMGENASSVLDRYMRNKALAETLGAHFGVRTLFVWQPAPTYKYDIGSHLFWPIDPGRHKYAGAGYEAAHERYRDGAFGDNFIWCADIQDGRKEPLYVDAFHYTAAFSRDIAKCILDGGLRAAVAP